MMATVARSAAKPARASKPKRRIRLDNDERRAQLLSLARRAFSDRSYDEVSIDDLAREAKISKGLFYHYFPTKRDLYVAGLSEIADELVARIAAVPRDTAPIESVRAGIDAYLDHISKHSRAYVSLMRGGIGSDPEVASVVEGVRKRMIEIFLEHSPIAPVLASNPRFHTLMRGWIGFVEGATIDWCENPRLSHDDVRELLVQVLMSMMQTIGPQIMASLAR